MGLKLSNSKNDFAIPADYWRIIAVETHYGGPNQLWPSKHAKPVTFVHVALYASKEARDAGAMSLRTERIVLDGERTGEPELDENGQVIEGKSKRNPDFLPEPTRAAAYAALKKLKQFKDALDDE